MAGKIFAVMSVVSFVFAAATGKMTELSGAILDAALSAVKLSFSMLGMTCVWCAVMRLLSAYGISRWLARLISPLLRLAFPESFKSGHGMEEIASNISANALGLGNAATPLALAAVKKIKETRGGDSEIAPDDAITLAVLNTAPLSLLPASILTLRRSFGSVLPASVVLPIWICSALSSVFAICISRAIASIQRKNAKIHK